MGNCNLIELITSIISTLVILSALLWTIFFPSWEEKERKKKDASFLRGSIRLYLDVLNDKLSQNDPGYYLQKVAITDYGPAISNFETLTKQNHDALEKLFLASDPLEFKEREKLRAFVRFFKGIPEMKTDEDFLVYKMKLEDVMEMFPEEKPK